MKLTLALATILLFTGCALFQTTDDKLTRDLARLGLETQKTPRGLVLYLPDVLFAFDSDQLTEPAAVKVNAVSEIILRLAPERALSVEGHTDSIGDPDYNVELSLRRANTVRTALANGGIPAEQIASVGFGERFPVAPNRGPDGRDDPEARAQNRRVEVVILR